MSGKIKGAPEPFPSVVLGSGLLFLHGVCPLFFFTDLTRNPYVLQIQLLHAGLLGLLALWLMQGVRRKSWFWHRSVLDVPLLVFAAAAFFSSFLSWLGHPVLRSSLFHESVRAHFFLWVNGLLVFFWGTQISGGSWDRRLRRTALAVGIAAGLYGIAQYAGWEFVWSRDLNPYSGRPVSTFGNPNFLSSYLVMLFPLGLEELLRTRSGLSRVGWTGALLVFAGALICTMTRSSWIGAGVSISFFLCSARSSLSARKGTLGFLAVISLSAVLFWPVSPSSGVIRPLSRMVELLHGVTASASYGSWHQRLLIWSSAWDMVMERPFFGKGWGGFELFYPFYQGAHMANDVFRPFRTHANNAHQVVLEIASQAGLVGLGIAFWIMAAGGIAFRRRFKTLPQEEKLFLMAPAAALAGLLADNFFGNVSLFFAVPAFLFFWLLGILFSREDSVSLPLRPASLMGSVLLAVLSMGGIVYCVRQSMAEIRYFDGYKLAHRGDLLGATHFLELSRRWRPYEVNNNYELANVYLRRGRQALEQGLLREPTILLESAVSAYDAALASNAGYDEIYFNKASALLALGRLEEAEKCLQMSLLINPTFPGSYKVLENLYRQSGRSTEADRLAAQRPAYLKE
jgi:O-antigen ligase